MTLLTQCPGCQHVLSVTLSDAMTEQEAQALAGRVWCVECALGDSPVLSEVPEKSFRRLLENPNRCG